MKKLFCLFVILSFGVEVFAQSEGSGQGQNIVAGDNRYPAGGIMPAEPSIPESAKGQRVGQAGVDAYQEENVQAYESCKKVRNQFNQNIFIPIRTQSEWDRFTASPPSSVSVADCGDEFSDREEEREEEPIEEEVVEEEVVEETPRERRRRERRERRERRRTPSSFPPGLEPPTDGLPIDPPPWSDPEEEEYGCPYG